MATLLMMPEIATGDEAATLTSWEVGVGSPFKATEIIATIETAKAAVEVEAESDGVILSFLVQAGSDVAVGDVLALLGSPGENVDDIGSVLAELGVSDGVVGIAPPVSRNDDVDVTAAAATRTRNASLASDVSASVIDDLEGWTRIFASPLARLLARDAGIALEDLVGTGPNGRIRRHDVKAAQARLAERPAAAPVAAPAAVVPGSDLSAITATAAASAAGHTDVPHSRLRRAIARRLTESVNSAPHFTVSGVASVDRLLLLRAEINESTAVRVSVNDLIVKAVACAHVAVPAMNAVWMPEVVRRFESVDIGLAVTTPTGLVVPVLRGVQTLRVSEIASVGKDLAVRAREGRLLQSELEGGSISVSNLGMFGTRSFTAIINPPQAAILAVGAAAPEAMVVDGGVGVRTVLHMTVSVDHRPVDGVIAAEWMRALVDVLEHPLGLLV